MSLMTSSSDCESRFFFLRLLPSSGVAWAAAAVAEAAAAPPGTPLLTLRLLLLLPAAEGAAGRSPLAWARSPADVAEGDDSPFCADRQASSLRRRGSGLLPRGRGGSAGVRVGGGGSGGQSFLAERGRGGRPAGRGGGRWGGRRGRRRTGPFPPPPEALAARPGGSRALGGARARSWSPDGCGGGGGGGSGRLGARSAPLRSLVC